MCIRDVGICFELWGICVINYYSSRRLWRLTSQLNHSTRIAQTVAALQSHDNPDVCALSKLITSAWSTQLAEERQRQALKSKTGPKPKGTGAAGCAACRGAHRVHTCV